MTGAPARRTGHGAQRVLTGALAVAGIALSGVTFAPPAYAADPVIAGCTIVSNPTEAHHTDCPNKNLSNKDLRDTDLSFANLAGANLSGAFLHEATLSGANLKNAKLNNTKLNNADLTGADLTGAILQQVTLSGATLTGADLTGATLTSANLFSADLSGADLTGATLTSANLFNADLSGADLSGADLSGAFLHEATLFRANLTGATLTNATLTNARMTFADLTAADLTAADLTAADLTAADLTDTDLTDTNFSGADLTDTKLSGASAGGVLLIPDNIAATTTGSAPVPVSWLLPNKLANLTGATYTCTPASGSGFPVGPTMVTCDIDTGDPTGAGVATFMVTINQVPVIDTVLPGLTGTAASGGVLTCTPGTWTGYPAPSFTYRFLRGATEVQAGSNTSTYAVTGSDRGGDIICLVTATNTTGDGTESSTAMSIRRGTQTISFTSTAPTGAVIGDSYTPAATATSNLPVALSIDASSAAMCTLAGGVVLFTAAGSCVINANQPGNGMRLEARQVQQTMLVGKKTQTISFTAPPPGDVVIGDSYTPLAMATSNLPVQFAIGASPAKVCNLDGHGVVSFIAAGSCVINANQSGNETWELAPPAAQTIMAGGVAPKIAVSGSGAFTVSKPGSMSFTGTGTPLPALSESGPLPAGLSFTINTDGTASISGTPKPGMAGNYEVTVSAISAAGHVTMKVTITVGRARTTLTITGPGSAKAGQAVTLSATVAGGDPPTGTVSFTIGSTSLGTATLDDNGHAQIITTDLPTGTVTVGASYRGDDTFASSSAQPVTVTVTVTAPPPSPTLANTGVPAGPLTELAVLLLTAGVALLASTRRDQTYRTNP